MSETVQHRAKRWISYTEAVEAVGLSRGTLWKLVESKQQVKGNGGRSGVKKVLGSKLRNLLGEESRK